MARPHNPRENAAGDQFEKLPFEWQEDPWVQHLYENMMHPANSWAEASEWHDSLRLYIMDAYEGADFDDYYNWESWRENYALNH